MPDLISSLHKHDLGHLRIIAGFWGLELESTDSDSALEELCASLLDLEAVTETIDILPADARTALISLVESNGKMEWPIFARKYGEIREMGEGRRDRERPHLKPISISEILFYRGMIAKAFFDSGKGAQEFAFIPEDLLELVGEEVQARKEERGKKNLGEPVGRPATPVEKAHEIPATDHILDDTTTYLAALRLNLESNSSLALRVLLGKQEQAPALQKLLTTANLVKNNTPQTEAVKKFLEASRAEASDMLFNAWLTSQTFDELRLIPSLICEGEWKNQPLVTREFLMDLVKSIPQNKWWSLPAFLRAIKEKFPDFQRPAGDYDSWFIKRASDGQFLRGFAYWDSVDGALVKYFIQVLHWLGRVNLAAPEEGKEATAFFLLSPALSSIEGSFVEKKEERGKIVVSSNGKVTVSRFFSRAVRYQISRFCEWDDQKNDDFIYSVSAQSLKRAGEQGLKAEQLLAMLVKHTNGTVPPAMVKALKRWEQHGAEARVESLLVLRVSRPEVMEEMRSSRAGKFLGELLSPTAVVVKSGAIEKVMAALAELGLLAEVRMMKSE
ncbi:MAG: helicase-associated domain-containing protein [Chloroflexi bacterium]|nr:helicase-associated domain-containing protein [Chloroflexota bacterium]